MAKRSAKNTSSQKKQERETHSNNFTSSTQQADILHKIREGRRKHNHDTKSIHVGKIQFLLFFLIGLGSSLIVGAYIWYQLLLQNAIISPIKLPQMILDNRSVSDEVSELMWGSYRPGVYFGLKTRTPKSPVFGVMWMQQPSANNLPSIRHWCDQNDGFSKYGWVANDGRNFGIHVAYDEDIIVVNDFVKRPGGLHGGDWTSRMQISMKVANPYRFVSAFVYLALDGQGHLAATTAADKLISIRGRSEQLGSFNLNLPRENLSQKNQSMNPAIWTDYLVTYAAGLEDLHDIVASNLYLRNVELPGGQTTKIVSLPGVRMPKGINEHEANFIVLQVTSIPPFEFETIFESASNSFRPNRLTGAEYLNLLGKYFENFHHKFSSKFHLEAKGFNESTITVAEEIVSNMVGGIGYFHGSSIIHSALLRNPTNYFERPLFTAVPSRSFFPRGFLWDEGFHQLLIGQWDYKISKEIIAHWFDLMNANGWIPREQILGLEARARVPAEFVTQYDDVANPPTFILPLRKIVNKFLEGSFGKDSEEILSFLVSLKPRLVAWYDWLNETQVNEDAISFHWRGRNGTTILELNPKTLASGLDDFPRASHPSLDERHLDLRCWMTLATQVIAKVIRVVDNKNNERFAEAVKWLSDEATLDKLHWSESAGRFADYGLHTDKVKLSKAEKPTKPNIPVKPIERVVAETPVLRLVDSVLGYVNIFPFLTQILNPSSTRLKKIMTDIRDPTLLWTNFGLRSLSPNSLGYNKRNTEHDPPYWRGAIWININYMAVAALKHYSDVEGPYRDQARDIYVELRNNLIENVLREFKRTGFVWEQYNDKNGEGKGCRPFTGWSALVVNLMAEEFW